MTKKGLHLPSYLAEAGLLRPGEPIGLRRLTGGVSCLTQLVERERGPDLVVKQALPKLEVEEDWYADPARIRVEAQAIEALQALLPPGTVPRLLHRDDDRHLVVMEAVPKPHANWKSMLLAGQIRRDHVAQFGQILARIHGASYRQARYRSAFADRQFFESLRLEPYYLFTAREVPAAGAFLRDLVRETRQLGLSLVHGDYSPKNMLVYRDRLHLLDHEVMHFGDGAFDLGFSLTHLLSKARHVVPSRQAFLEAALHFWQTYRSGFAADADWEARAVRHTIACLLARARGKSPLEYLTAVERERQVELCRRLLVDPPATVPLLIETIRHAYATEP